MNRNQLVRQELPRSNAKYQASAAKFIQYIQELDEIDDCLSPHIFMIDNDQLYVYKNKIRHFWETIGFHLFRHDHIDKTLIREGKHGLEHAMLYVQMKIWTCSKIVHELRGGRFIPPVEVFDTFHANPPLLAQWGKAYDRFKNAVRPTDIQARLTPSALIVASLPGIYADLVAVADYDRLEFMASLTWLICGARCESLLNANHPVGLLPATKSGPTREVIHRLSLYLIHMIDNPTVFEQFETQMVATLERVPCIDHWDDQLFEKVKRLLRGESLSPPPKKKTTDRSSSPTKPSVNVAVLSDEVISLSPAAAAEEMDVSSRDSSDDDGAIGYADRMYPRVVEDMFERIEHETEGLGWLCRKAVPDDTDIPDLAGRCLVRVLEDDDSGIADDSVYETCVDILSDEQESGNWYDLVCKMVEFCNRSIPVTHRVFVYIYSRVNRRRAELSVPAKRGIGEVYGSNAKMAAEPPQKRMRQCDSPMLPPCSPSLSSCSSSPMSLRSYSAESEFALVSAAQMRAELVFRVTGCRQELYAVKCVRENMANRLRCVSVHSYHMPREVWCQLVGHYQALDSLEREWEDELERNETTLFTLGEEGM